MAAIFQPHTVLYILPWFDATAKSPKSAVKTTATLQNQMGEALLMLASGL